MACECQYFFLALVESRREEFISHISPSHCPGNRGHLFFLSVVTVSCTQSSWGGGEELCVQSQRCTVSVEAAHMDTSMASTALEQPALEQDGVSGVCMSSAVRREHAYGKVLGFVLVGSAVVA